MSSTRRGSVMLGAAVALAIGAIVSLALGFSMSVFHDSSYVVSAHYPTANGLIAGSDVFIGGVKVGAVRSLDVDPDGKGVVVTAAIGQQYGPVHSDATMYIRPKSLLGEKYLDLGVGSTSKAALPSGSRLPDSATQINVEIDQLINMFDEPTRKELQALIHELGTGLAGQGRMTNETFQSGAQNLTALANVTDVLQTRDAELKRIIDALTRLTQTISSDQQRTTYVHLLQHSDQVLQTLKDEDAQVQQGIDRMDSFFGSVDAGTAGRQADLQAIFADLPNTITALDSLSVNLGGKAHTALPVVKQTLPAALGGDLIFGSQPDNKNAFTTDIFTRVMPTQGCFNVDFRTKDPKTGQVSDTGTPIPGDEICTTAGGISNATDLVTALCKLAAQIPGCPHAAAAAPTTSRRTATAPQAPSLDATTEQQLIRYLLQ